MPVLTAKEINIFFAILFKARNLNSLKVTMSCNELRILSDGDCRCNRFFKSVDNTFKKLMNVNSEFENYQTKSISCVFTNLVFDKINSSLTITINPNICCLAKDTGEKFTAFKLEDLNSIKGAYAKNMFRLLQQFKNSTFFIVYFDKLKYLLGIPVSYSASKIDQRVFEPIVKELSIFFKNLRIKKIKKGRSVYKLKCSWISHSRFKRLEAQNKALIPFISEEAQNREIRDHITEIETKKSKLFPRLVKFISNIKEFDKLHQILHAITTEDELNNFKIEYNL